MNVRFSVAEKPFPTLLVTAASETSIVVIGVGLLGLLKETKALV